MTYYEQLQIVHNEMLAQFREEPFHNLYQRLKVTPRTLALGGTCSDKALSFQRRMQRHGIHAEIHTAWMSGCECHRLVKLALGRQVYYADVGNGWPSVQLYSRNEAVSYLAYGIGFHTSIHEDQIKVYITRDDQRRHMMDIRHATKPQSEVRRDIEHRFTEGKRYPFSDGIRFSQVMGDRFLFLRDDQLMIYSEQGESPKVINVGVLDLRIVLSQYFGFNLTDLY